MPKITPFLWFDGQAEEAMNYYLSIFKNGKVLSVIRMNGKVLTVSFELEGQQFMALNPEPLFRFNEAISLFVDCETQEEVDELWEKLSARRREKPLRLAEGQVRSVVADHSQSADAVDERSRSEKVERGHASHAQDEQNRH